MTRTRKPTAAEVAQYKAVIHPLQRQHHAMYFDNVGHTPAQEFAARVLRAKIGHLTYQMGVALRPTGLRIVLQKSPAADYVSI